MNTPQFAAMTKKLTRKTHRIVPHRRGAATVEFAVVAPLLVLLLFGMIEFGRMIMVQQVLTNASREGARLAALDGSTTEGVKDTVVNYLENAALAVDRDRIVIEPAPESAAKGAPIRVTVSVPFDDVSWLSHAMYLKSVDLQASATMRRETVQ